MQGQLDARVEPVRRERYEKGCKALVAQGGVRHCIVRRFWLSHRADRVYREQHGYYQYDEIARVDCVRVLFQKPVKFRESCL